jgi:hypothetical protein
MYLRAYSITIAMFALGNLGTIAASAEPIADDNAQAAIAPATTQSAARVYIDPKTGHMSGPPAGVEPPGLSIALQKKLSRSDRGLEKRLLPNGAMLVNLQGRFQNMSVVTIAPDGEPHITCNHSVDEAEHALAHGEGDRP